MMIEVVNYLCWKIEMWWILRQVRRHSKLIRKQNAEILRLLQEIEQSIVI